MVEGCEDWVKYGSEDCFLLGFELGMVSGSAEGVKDGSEDGSKQYM
jgi:hypothetical protein